MKREFVLERLDCANCAAKIEKRVAALPGVNAAALAFAMAWDYIKGALHGNRKFRHVE